MKRVITHVKGRPGKLLLMAFGAILITSYQDCSPVGFRNSPAVVPASLPGSTGTTNTIKTIQPALAVRDTSCLACHGNIKANVITDFGYGNSWFLGGSGSYANSGIGSYHYSPISWQSLQQISGQVFIPQATVPAAMVNKATGTSNSPNVSLQTFLTMSSTIDYDAKWAYTFWNRPAPANFSLDYYVSAPAGQSPIVSESTVYIGAPSVSQIQGLVSSADLNNSGVWVKQVGTSASGVSGLASVAGVNGTSYITNSGGVQCSGADVVVNGTLLLNSAQIYAENGGCRLYVTGPVFIEGPINYLNSGTVADATDNLQIASAVGVFLGVGIAGTNPLQNRLTGDYRAAMLLRTATTSADYLTYANNILTAAQNIGGTLLQDASNTAGAASTGQSAANPPQTRVSINYQHLLLNAPMIHSRYLGNTSGIIVAEVGVFSLGEFSYSYDPVFENVSVLPAFPNQDILCAQDTGGCNPINP